MKLKLLFLVLYIFLSNTIFSQDYNVTFNSVVKWPGKYCANIWGFAKDGKEYALVGVADGMVVMDVTNPASPVFIQQLTDTITNLWREIKTYGNYAYITSEGSTPSGYGGVGIANLTNLPNPSIPFKKYHGDGGILNQLKRSHSLHVDTTKGYCYIYGATGLANGGAIALDLNTDPYNPVFAGMQTARYIHDGYVDNDIMYAAELGNSGITNVRVVDFTVKNSPVTLATFQTPTYFCHNTWPSNDKNYLFTTDENSGSYLASFDISDLGNITLLDKIQPTPGSGSIVHNTYIKDHFAVTSWYTDGITITDISRPGNLVQVGRYDTYPNGSGNGFKGCWGVYPYLPSGNLLVTNISNAGISMSQDTGKLFVLTPDYKNACYLEGIVTDSLTGQLLNGVDVKINHTDPLNSTLSIYNGNYATGQVTPGTFTVTYTKSAYVTKTISATLTAGGLTIQNVQLRSIASLPLELVEIKAIKEGNTNKILWSTLNELNTKTHIIQRKDGANSNWENIGEVAAAGNSLHTLNYEFVDKNPTFESYYRIKTLDIDGSDFYSNIVSVVRPVNNFRVLNLYPNPSKGDLNMQVIVQKNQNISFKVLSNSGKLVYQQISYLNSGYHTVELHLPESLSNDNYLLLIDNGTEVITEKINLSR
ncbi:MAG: choice-of-anchor B family protein [Saprospiraceae bacterium]|nr:choice-of-anchor B family protein [Saprospiraceae bacterium]